MTERTYTEAQVRARERAAESRGARDYEARENETRFSLFIEEEKGYRLEHKTQHEELSEKIDKLVTQHRNVVVIENPEVLQAAPGLLAGLLKQKTDRGERRRTVSSWKSWVAIVVAVGSFVTVTLAQWGVWPPRQTAIPPGITVPSPSPTVRHTP